MVGGESKTLSTHETVGQVPIQGPLLELSTPASSVWPYWASVMDRGYGTYRSCTFPVLFFFFSNSPTKQTTVQNPPFAQARPASGKHRHGVQSLETSRLRSKSIESKYQRQRAGRLVKGHGCALNATTSLESSRDTVHSSCTFRKQRVTNLADEATRLLCRIAANAPLR